MSFENQSSSIEQNDPTSRAKKMLESITSIKEQIQNLSPEDKASIRDINQELTTALKMSEELGDASALNSLNLDAIQNTFDSIFNKSAAEDIEIDIDVTPEEFKQKQEYPQTYRTKEEVEYLLGENGEKPADVTAPGKLPEEQLQEEASKPEDLSV